MKNANACMHAQMHRRLHQRQSPPRDSCQCFNRDPHRIDSRKLISSMTNVDSNEECQRIHACTDASTTSSASESAQRFLSMFQQGPTQDCLSKNLISSITNVDSDEECQCIHACTEASTASSASESSQRFLSMFQQGPTQD